MPLFLSGSGVGGMGALTNSSNSQFGATYAGRVSLQADASIVANNGNILVEHWDDHRLWFHSMTLDGTATACSIAGIIGTSTGSITKNGTGTWTVSGANTFTGPVTLNAGALATPTLATLGNAQGLGEGSAVNFNGGTLRFTNASAFNPGSNNGLGQTFNFGANGGTIDMSEPASNAPVFFAGTFAGIGQISVINSNLGVFQNDFLQVTSASPSYTGNIVLGNSSGRQSGLQYRSTLANALGIGVITINPDGFLTTDTGAVTGTAVLSNSIVLNGGTLGTQSQPAVFTGGITLQAANSFIGSPPNDSTTGAILISCPIIGVGGLTKNSGDTCTFSGINTYTGNTTIAGGVLNLGVAESPGVSGPLGAQSASAAGTIVMKGGALQCTSTNTFDYSGRFAITGSQSWGIDTNGLNMTLATPLQGALSALKKSGAGSLFLPVANTHTGNTTVLAGSLVLLNPLALQDSPAGGTGIVFDSSVGNAFTLGGFAGGGTITLLNNAPSPSPARAVLRKQQQRHQQQSVLFRRHHRSRLAHQNRAPISRHSAEPTLTPAPPRSRPAKSTSASRRPLESLVPSARRQPLAASS